ncbi:MAG: hypothetical protein HGA19_00125 [Oscillochloris sp.]|nr:hypothetical protein [Oscillochloris sp.]
MPTTPLIRTILAAALCAWLITLAILLNRPIVPLADISGLYKQESLADNTYRWSGDRVTIPISRHSGQTQLIVRAGALSWEERTPPHILLESDTQPLATFDMGDQLRRYILLLPPETSTLTIHSSVARPPGDDKRWLGFTFYSVSAKAKGLPLDCMYLAFLLLPFYLTGALGLTWALKHNLGIPLLLFGVALALRTIRIESSPPGWRIDEVVSLVDAWHLIHTGRDHLGHLLPLGAFEALGDWISPLLTYLELPFVALAGPQLLVGRLVTATIGALAAPLGYALARTLGINRTGMFATGLAMALSPWQISMSRSALPPSLVPTFWILCILAGAHFILHRTRHSALMLAIIAGIALYAYPTMKMAVPILGVLILGLALLQNWQAAKRQQPYTKLRSTDTLPAAILLVLLWTPFAYITLFNPASATRLNQAALKASSWINWIKAWWVGYSVYAQPDFYFRVGDGSPNTGVPGFGMELWATLPLFLVGMAGLLGGIVQYLWGDRTMGNGKSSQTQRAGIALYSVILLLGALLIAAFPSSVTTPSPHGYRAAQIAPLYAIIVGYGAGFLLPHGWQIDSGVHYWGRQIVALGLVAGLLWQGAIWWQAYQNNYPQIQASANQDGLNETMRRVVEIAPAYDEIWVSYDSIDEPYIYVLAAQPFPPSELHQMISVTRRPNRFNDVTRIGPYHFVDTSGIPSNLPTPIAIPAYTGGRGYMAQEWEDSGHHILIVRQM